MINVEFFLELDKKIKSLKEESMRTDILVSEKLNLESQIKKGTLEFNKEALKKLNDFTVFYNENQSDLYYNWPFMNRIKRKDRIDLISYSKTKKALKFVFVNNTEGYCNYNVVLVPFDFIENKEDFKIKRAKYVKKAQIEMLQTKVKKDEEELQIKYENLEKDKLKLKLYEKELERLNICK